MYRALLLLTIFMTACATSHDVPPTRPPQSDAPIPPPGLSRLNDGLISRPCDAGMCFIDATGTTRYWVKDGRFYSAEILARQQRYNAWIERKRRFPIGVPVRIVSTLMSAQRTWSGSALVLPERLRETGRLDIDTIAIPYYRSVLALLIEADAFARDCDQAYTPPRDATLASFCAASRDIWQDEAQTATLLNKKVLLRLDPALRLRLVMLQRAFIESAAYGKALDALFRDVSGNGQINVETDGIDPDQIKTERFEALEAADLKLTGALSQVKWAAAAYRSHSGLRKSRGTNFKKQLR